MAFNSINPPNIGTYQASITTKPNAFLPGQEVVEPSKTKKKKARKPRKQDQPGVSRFRLESYNKTPNPFPVFTLAQTTNSYSSLPPHTTAPSVSTGISPSPSPTLTSGLSDGVTQQGVPAPFYPPEASSNSMGSRFAEPPGHQCRRVASSFQTLLIFSSTPTVRPPRTPESTTRRYHTATRPV